VKIRSVEFREAVPVNGDMSTRIVASEGNVIRVSAEGVVFPGPRHRDRDGCALILVPWANVRWVVAEES
jgi:hypothetical protein